jgi:hypothetical protein
MNSAPLMSMKFRYSAFGISIDSAGHISGLVSSALRVICVQIYLEGDK